MKQLTKKGFWRGVYGVGVASCFVWLAEYMHVIENELLTADQILKVTMLFCLLVFFGYAFTWNERR